MMASSSTSSHGNSVIQGSTSKERWFPGDPLPWTSRVYQGITFPVHMYDKMPAFAGFETRPDDVFLVTYPKSGTTWMLQLIKCLRTKGHPETLARNHSELYPWIEYEPAEAYTSLPSPRVLKSHSPCHLLPKGKTPDTKAKYIHVMRNPKDVCVSFFHHMRSYTAYEYNGKFAEFFDLFVHGKVICGNWFEFVRGWLECKDEAIIHVMYEDMQRKPADVIQRVADFMGLECNEEIIKLTLEKIKFSNMKEDPFGNMKWTNVYRHDEAVDFMRKGVVGDWKNHFTEEQNGRFDIWLEENSLPGVEFIY